MGYLLYDVTIIICTTALLRLSMKVWDGYYIIIVGHYLTSYVCFAGITHQSEKFPVRFIVELLNKQCRIVLTGKVNGIFFLIIIMCSIIS